MVAEDDSPHGAQMIAMGLAAAAAALLAGCGAGSAAVVASGGDGGGTNAAPVLSGFSVLSSRVSPATFQFRLADEESNTARVTLHYQVGGSPPRPISRIESGMPSNPATLAAPRAGVDYVIAWDFSAEQDPDLHDDARFVPDVRVYATVEGGIQSAVPGTNAVVLGVGNDRPVITIEPLADDVGGVIPVRFDATDSSGDLLRIQVEFDLAADATEQWTLARPAGLAMDEPTPEFAFVGQPASASGSSVVFFWDSDHDLHGLAQDVRLRFSAHDPVTAGLVALSPVFRVDNNEEPIVSIQEGFLLSSDDERRGIPIPVTVIDAEANHTDVVFQWRRPGESFPRLPATREAVQAILDDPELRREYHVCSEYPRPVEGDLHLIDSLHLRIPELASSAAHLVAHGIVGREIEILRPGNRYPAVARGWSDRSLVRPVAAAPLGDGIEALVLDEPAIGSWRLRAIELATGSARDVANGSGTPTAMALERDEHSALIATIAGAAWSVARVQIDDGAVEQLVAWDGTTEGGAIRGIASLGRRSSIATIGSSLVRLAYPSSGGARSVTVVQNLATPWGVVAAPQQPSRVYVAERDKVGPLGSGRVIAIDLDTLQVTPVVALAESGVEPGFVRPRALAIDRRGLRLLALCDVDPGVRSELREVELGGVEQNHAFTVSDFSPSADSLSLGADHLRIVTRFESAELWVGHGVEQRRRIAAYEPVTRIVTLDEALAPSPAPGSRWRMFDTYEAVSSSAGTASAFVWDSADAGGGDILFRATPFDDELGIAAQTVAAKHVLGPLQGTELVVGGGGTTVDPSSVVLADMDADGDLDLVSANVEGNTAESGSLTIFDQERPGIFAPTPTVLRDMRPGRVSVDVAAADLDGDGDQDIVTTDVFSTDGATRSSGVSVLLQRTPSSYQRLSLGEARSPAQYFDRPLAIGDLNDDRWIDIVFTRGSDDALTVLVQTAPGIFDPTPAAILGGPGITGSISSISIADLDQDGRNDVVCVNQASNDLAVFKQVTAGVFDPTPLRLGNLRDTPAPTAVACGDLNGDEALDIAVALSSSAVIFFQTGPGEFTLYAFDLYLSGQSAIAIACADLDQDEDLDLVVGGEYATQSLGALSICMQTSEGVFSTPPFAHTISGGPTAIVCADSDGDGDQDILASTRNGVNIYLQTSAGHFGNHSIIRNNGSATSLAAPDLDGDGDRDLLTTSQFSRSALIATFQTSPNSFGPISLVLTSSGNLLSPVVHAISDLDDDGNQEILATNAQRQVVILSHARDRSISRESLVLSGGFDAEVDPDQVMSADLNGDGRQDLIVAASFSSRSTVLMQSESGAFGPEQFVPENDLGNYIDAFATGDVDGDGDLDLASASGSGSLSVFWQTSSGSFSQPLTLDAYPVAYGARAIAMADLDDDGDQDLASANSYANTVTLFFQKSPGIFEPTPSVLGGPGVLDSPSQLRVADLDGDQDQDIVTLPPLTIFLQTRPGVFERYASGLGDARSTLSGLSIALGDIDADGVMDLVTADEASNQMTILFQDQRGGVDAAYALPFTRSAAGDVNGDGLPDAWHREANGLQVSIQVAPRHFDPVPVVVGNYGAQLYNPGWAQSVDIDGDARQDLVITDWNSTLRVLRQSQPLMFAGQLLGGSGTLGPYPPVVTDVDGDGLDDLLTPNKYSHIVTIFFQQAGGLFNPTPIRLGGPGITQGATSVAVADLDGDGDYDIASANQFADHLTVFFQVAPRTFTIEPITLASPDLNGPLQIAAADLDGDSDQDLVSVNGESVNATVFWQTAPGEFGKVPLVVGGIETSFPAWRLVIRDVDRDGDPDLVVGDSAFSQTAPGVFSALPRKPFVMPIDVDADGE